MEEEGGREKDLLLGNNLKAMDTTMFHCLVGSPINQEGEDYFEVNWG